MGIQVRYFSENRLVATSSAETMFEARRQAGASIPPEADAAAIYAIRSNGRELEIELLEID